ncbi:MAG: ABC transporter permease [Verrucomicrobia bacterium]|nr:ABC transporter permease [Cytophagales bacterium]
MLKFIFNRLSYGFLVILGVIIVVFLLFQVLPGDTVSLMVDQSSDQSVRQAIMRDFGLDQPKSKQLAMYFNDLSPVSVHPDNLEEKSKYNYAKITNIGENALVLKKPFLRRSYQNRRRVDDIIFEHLPGTIWLALSSMLFATTFGILFGVLAALRQNTFWDHFLVTVSVLGISAPSFVAAVLISQFFGNYLPNHLGINLGLNTIGSLYRLDTFNGLQLEVKNIILPTIALGIRPLAIIVQLTRSAMLDVLSQDYIRTAKAKGVHYVKVVTKHALKNALNPVVTAVSGWLASLLAGAFFIEYIFDYKGLGFITLEAVGKKDLPVVMGAILFIALIFVVINILVDIVYAMIDPRVKLD